MSIPDDVRAQLDELVSGIAEVLGDDLVGVYLHGSLALGCFNPQQSDVDVIVLLARRTTEEEREALAPVLLRCSGSMERPRRPPYPLEFDALVRDDLKTWRYPTRFHLHWGERRRGELESGIWLLDFDGTDLAAHITLLHLAGVALAGPPPREVFPDVPRGDFVDSLLGDLDWSREQDRKLYSVLSASRIWATLLEGGLQSKATGAEWALQRAPAEFRPLIASALAVYRGELGDAELDVDEANAYVDFVRAQLTDA